MKKYDDFLRGKIVSMESAGFGVDVADLHGG